MNSYEYRDNLGNPRDYYDIVNDATKLCEEIEEKDKEIERLNNIIDELEKWLNEVDIVQRVRENIPNDHITIYNVIADKLKELKEGVDNE